MKRFLLILILLFPILTLVYWVYRGDAIRPRKTLDTTNGIPENIRTNLPTGTNSSATTNPPNTNEPPPAK